MKIGNEVSFTYLKGASVGNVGGIIETKDYNQNSESYSGTVVEIRDIEKEPLAWETVQYGSPKGERSQNLVTVELEDGFTKAFYDGRMVNRQVSSPAS